MPKVLICGPRDWVEQKPIEDILRLLPKDTVIIHGGQTGVDNIAGFVAKTILGMPVRSYPVDHKLDGPWPGAGPRRNMRMLASESPFESDGSYVAMGIAFKKQERLTPGTGSMVSLMQSGGIGTVEILYQKSEWSNYLKILEEELFRGS